MKYFFFTAISFILIVNHAKAQGCSDAGFCTIASFKPKQGVTEHKQAIKFGVNIGAADNNIVAFGNYLEYANNINKNISITAKIATLAQSGNGVSAFGIGDLFLNSAFTVATNNKITIGVKLPLTNGNAKKNGLSLPMDYQASLGTTDLILGYSTNIKKLQLVAALQQPLTQNSNGYLKSSFPTTSIFNSTNIRFFESNKFKRSGDALIRISYPVSFTKQIKFTPSILPIYHFSNDSYTNALNVEKEIIDSKGLTVNVNAFLDYTINAKNIVQLSFGTPLVVRTNRPDGLTRSVVVGLEYSFKF